MFEPKASQVTSTSKGQNQLMDSLIHSNLNSSNDEIDHNNNVVGKSQETDFDQKQVESEVVENKSNLETLLQPRELVQCEVKKLEIHQAPPIDAQAQLISRELPTKELSHGGQGNQDFQPHQTPPFVELNSVAQESVSSRNDTQVLPQESISETTDFMMERRNSPNVKDQESTDVGKKLTQPEDADTEKSDYAANLETQTYNSHP
ncbi:hypothetical protein K7X08_020014 [Anisodus acutangulus]|uniref:Uncharacterized protein n=1 Tax=Anisodus acutangulus TaxID=402998 RepID=A0A9Q1MTG2_9SOLA|nr:hypothetical protein K7X08_020014 [Anisodus acutangulus]